MEHKLKFEYYFLSVGLQEPYLGVCLSVEERDVIYDGQNLKNCIFVKYNVSKINWDSELSQEDVAQIIIAESDLFVKAFYLLLINPCKLLMYSIFVDDVEFEPKYSSQSLGSLYNLLVERNKLKGSQSLTTLVDKNGWPILEELVTQFRLKSAAVKNKTYLVLRWCAKASNEYASIDRLVAYWISFNSLFEGLEDSEQKSIEKYIDNNLDLFVAERLCSNFKKQLSILASLGIELRNKRKVGKELNELLAADNKDYVLIVKKMLLIIYGIRNNLFHGNYDPESSQIRINIVVAERVLSEFMNEIVTKEMLGYSLPSSVFCVQTKIGIG